MIRRIIFVWLLLAVAFGASANIAGASSSDESSMVAKINAERTAAGLNTLQVHSDLTAGARAWTAVMISDGAISHNPNLAGVTTGWSSLGENVGVGPNVDRLHTAFMNSSGHRANILGNFNYIGVGADRAPDGNLYITVVFMLKGSITTTTTAPPTTTTTAPPTTTTVPTTTPTTVPATTPTTVAPPAPTTTTVPTATRSPRTTVTHPPIASAAPTPFFDTAVAAGHLSIDHSAIYPCTEGMIKAPTTRRFCVV